MEKYRPYNNKDLIKTRQQLRRGAPLPESLLWSKLKGKQLLGIKFRRQYGIDRFIVDFYCPSHRLAIEINGDSHYNKKAKENDLNRDEKLSSRGIMVLRFSNAEVTSNLDGVLSEISRKLDTIPPLTPPSLGGES